MDKILGKKVKDTVTGLEGIAVSKHEYYLGTTEYGIQILPLNGAPQNVLYVKEGRVEVLETT